MVRTKVITAKEEERIRIIGNVQTAKTIKAGSNRQILVTPIIKSVPERTKAKKAKTLFKIMVIEPALEKINSTMAQ